MNDTLTPKPKEGTKAMTMSFCDAVRAILTGKMVKRISWGNKDYCLMKDGFLSIYTTKDNQLHSWIINDGDAEGQDWIIVTELN